jgi:hypothetical protein
MEGEKINTFSRIYKHYEKRIKSSYFQPGIPDLRAIYRKYWYFNYYLANIL